MESGTELQNEIDMFTSRLKEAQDKFILWTSDEAHHLINSQTARHDSALKEGIEQREKYKNIITDKQKENIQTNQVLGQKCQELQELKNELEQMYTVSHELHTTKDQAETEMESVKSDIKQIERAIEAPTKAKQKLEYLSKASNIFGDMLGLSFKKTRGNKMQVIFTHIDERDPLMTFYFFLQIQGAGRRYVVSDPEPAVDGVEELVTRLNETNNLRQFIIAMRNKFKDSLKK